MKVEVIVTNVNIGLSFCHICVVTQSDCWTQVLSRTSDAEPLGWWPARIKMMKGEFAVVDYVGYESTYSDILALDSIRHRNTKYIFLLLMSMCGLSSMIHTWNIIL